jgi:hypothetical protein
VVALWLGSFVQTVKKNQLNYEKLQFSEQHFTILYIVAEQMHEFSYMQNPPKCVGGNPRFIVSVF